jgi:hypothetical protein
LHRFPANPYPFPSQCLTARLPHRPLPFTPIGAHRVRAKPAMLRTVGQVGPIPPVRASTARFSHLFRRWYNWDLPHLWHLTPIPFTGRSPSMPASRASLAALRRRATWLSPHPYAPHRPFTPSQMGPMRLNPPPPPPHPPLLTGPLLSTRAFCANWVAPRRRATWLSPPTLMRLTPPFPKQDGAHSTPHLRFPSQAVRLSCAHPSPAWPL